MTRLLVLFASVALAIPLSIVAGVSPADAVTLTPNTWAQLQAAMATASSSDIVALGADITADTGGAGLAVAPGSTLVLDLNGHTLTIESLGPGYAGIHVPATAHLTIQATGGGSLFATGGSDGLGSGGGGSGIGLNGDDLSSSGSVTITGGTVFAHGGRSRLGGGGGGSGIGGGGNASTSIYAPGGGGGNVTITGGTVTAVGAGGYLGGGGSGIGGGGGGSDGGAGGSVTITGGTVTATGGDGDFGTYDGSGSGIGGGGAGSGGPPGGSAGGSGGTGIDVQATATLGSATSAGDGVAFGIGGGMAATLSSSVTPPGVSYTATAADGYIPASSGGTVTIVFHFLVGFDSASGSLVADQIVDDGDAATEPPAPTRGGYEFTGWHLGTTSGALWNFATPITAPTTLVAGWTVQTELAATGADTSGLAGLAWLLLLTGAAAVTVRRRHPADRPK